MRGNIVNLLPSNFKSENVSENQVHKETKLKSSLSNRSPCISMLIFDLLYFVLELIPVSWVCLTSQSTFLVLRKKNAVFLFWDLIIRASPPYSTTLNQMRKNIITQCQLWDSAWKNSKVWKLFNVVCNANFSFCNMIFFYKLNTFQHMHPALLCKIRKCFLQELLDWSFIICEQVDFNNNFCND